MTLRPLRCSIEITECHDHRSCDESGENVPAAATKIKKIKNIGRGALFSGYNSEALQLVQHPVLSAQRKTRKP